jgi:folate-binding protein YgfZ
MTGRIAELPGRGVVAVGGPDAGKFLDDLITVEVGRIAGGNAVYGGLLTPQGKILFDFILFADRDRFLFDIVRSAVPDFIKRLGLYKLRAKVDIADLSNERIVVAAWDADAPPILDGPVAPDPRLAALGFRAIVAPGADMAPGYEEATPADYHARRIALGIPESGVDFQFGEAFPYDADMDQLGGIDFDKGCYVGQEVVSRMKHRGTARRRVVIARGDRLPPSGTPVTAGEVQIGAFGSSACDTGLALVRLDRAREAMDAGRPIMAGDAPVLLAIPPWAAFTWPEAG